MGLAVAGLLPASVFAQNGAGPERLKDKVAQMLKADADNPPPTEGVLFAGDDTIAGWDVRHAFGQYRTVNRGLPGATFADVAFYAGELIVPLKPSTIVIEAGVNDLLTGQSPDAIAADFGALAAKIHTALPKTMIVLVAARPTVARSVSLGAIGVLNIQLQVIASKDKGIRFVSLDDLLLPTGEPDPSLLAGDHETLNKLGYDMLFQSVRKELTKAEAKYWRGYDPVDGQ